MSRTYRAVGINLRGMALGEADRLLTVLTREVGLIRVVAPGARKHGSKLGGRSGLFIVNDLLLSRGRTLDKISQAETLESYTGLSQDLGKLTAAQYLAELALLQALTDQPQEELFMLLTAHLSRLEVSDSQAVLANLVQGSFHLLALAGLAPQVHACAVSQQALLPNFSEPDWRVGFSLGAGGIVSPARLSEVAVETYLGAAELAAFQHLAGDHLACDQGLEVPLARERQPASWAMLERLLRRYAQYHLDQPIRSAALIESCFPLSA
ncbi:DNA repair protein RecO [Leptolyngbya sp. FACHB-261]|uniref:DNA repair protein RecO n=1 Tax=Leptolyngbya sp. FACHB-261 TaxID=2692806 RepID=UPI001687885B|nr:DNA repair protein RecO [Leptolyngbya sp. FACHB-261]MBD2101190.1 DNA repair protein RecO [Leptolyngbya sp. FACHB-261]